MVMIIKWRSKSIFIMIVRFLTTNQIRQGLKFNWICMDCRLWTPPRRTSVDDYPYQKRFEINLVASLRIII